MHLSETHIVNRFCIVRDGHLPEQICSTLITTFNNIREKSPGRIARYNTGGIPNFNELNLMMELPTNQIQYLTGAAFEALRYYKSVVYDTRYWPAKFGLEHFRIKHYAPGGEDRFDIHVDAASNETSKRFLIFFWYLNTVDVGGETEIFLNGAPPRKVKPQVGRLIMFPPFWMFPHQGHPPMSGDKYLLSSYLHYDDRHGN